MQTAPTARLRHAGIVVDDLHRALAFYRDLLGLPVVAHMEESGPVLDAILGLTAVRVTTIKLGEPPGPLVELLHFEEPASPPRLPGATHVPGLRHVAFTVADLDGLHEKMTAAGVGFLAPPQCSADGRVKVTYCRDFEGNFVELVEVLS